MLFSLLSKCTQNLTFSHLLITSYPSGPSLPIIDWITLKDFWEVSLIYLCSLSILSVLFYLFSTQRLELSVLNTSDNVLLPSPKPLRKGSGKKKAKSLTIMYIIWLHYLFIFSSPPQYTLAFLVFLPILKSLQIQCLCTCSFFCWK